MAGEFEWEEIADMAVEDLRASVNTEKCIIEEEHELRGKLFAWDSVIAHIDERDHDKHSLSGKISGELSKIRDFVEGTELEAMKFKEEDEKLLRHLEDDVRHRNWRAVKKDLEDEEELNHLRNRVRLDLIIMEKKFKQLLALIGLELKHLRKHMGVENKKDDFEKKEEYYFLQIYKFVKAYAEIFRDLVLKDDILTKKLGKNKNP